MRFISKLSAKKVCKIFGVSSDWYYRHKNQLQCKKSLLGKCFKEHPNQLTIQEVIEIENLLSDPENQNRNKISIYFEAMNNEIINCCKSTFYKYSKLLGFTSFKKKNKTPRKIGFRATRPFEWLHVDITQVQTVEDGIQKVAFVRDNFSTAILHYKSTDGKAGSEFITELFKETFEMYDIYNKESDSSLTYH